MSLASAGDFNAKPIAFGVDFSGATCSGFHLLACPVNVVERGGSYERAENKNGDGLDHHSTRSITGIDRTAVTNAASQ